MSGVLNSEPAGDPRALALATLGAAQPQTRAHAVLQFLGAVRAELTDPLTSRVGSRRTATRCSGLPTWSEVRWGGVTIVSC